MQFSPHDYQAYCIQRVVEDPAVGLFLRPGLGKTVITLSAVNVLKYFRWQVSKVLVVAPKKVAEATWSKEAAKWDHLHNLRISVVLGSASKRIKALSTPADVYIINRENVEWLVDYFKQAWPFDMVVLDESTSFKNPSSKRFKAMRRIRRFVKKMVLLTGTPSSKGLIDLWAQVYLLDGGERLGTTLGQYRERYFDPDQRSRTQIFSYKAKEGAEAAVLSAISDICIHTTILVIKNYDGEDLGKFRRNLATYGAVKVRSYEGSDGGVDTLTLEVNSENYKALLALLKDAIIENARGYDAKDDRMSGNPNQMNIQSMYSDIDLDANGIEMEFQASMEELLWFVNKHLANTGKGNFDGAEVKIIFDRDVLINESETITNCKNSVGILSDETIIKMHPWVTDPEQELERIKREKEEAAADPYRAAFEANRGGGNNPPQDGGTPPVTGGEDDGQTE